MIRFVKSLVAATLLTATVAAAEPGPVVWFDLPAADLDRASNFYGELFGWTMTRQPEGWTMITIDGKEAGTIMTEHTPGAGTTIYFAVEDIAAAHQKALDLGGTELFPPMTIPGDTGSISNLKDTEGNALGLWSPNPVGGAAVAARRVSVSRDRQ